VISAFTLSNWKDNSKSHNAENRILTEIYHGLEKDLKDVISNESGHKAGIIAAGYFTDILAKKPVCKDSVLFHYFNLTRDFVSIQNTSGYETLKSRGLELIENDSLRTNIISLYEYDYNILRKLEEEYFELQFHENYFKEINQSISSNFEFDNNKKFIGISLPLKISEKDEKVLLTYLWKIQVNRNFILQFYSDVKKKIEKTRGDIEKEIKR
ncbi:MAG: hypothetical protein GX660_23965, partial [Clostridiaceae bacterium]|nr:hypothetical protein [Clostridiaceae bacterium]